MKRTIVVASKNPVKIQAVQNGFQRVFPQEDFSILSVSVSSGVSIQPLSDEETFLGALNRAKRAAQIHPHTSYAVGIEGGVEQRQEGMAAFAWVVIISGNRVGRSRTGTFFLPDKIARLIREGAELGEADDQFFQRKNSKQEDGAVGLLTGNIINRMQLYEQAVILALIPFINREYYPS